MRYHPALSFAPSADDEARYVTTHVGIGGLAPATPGGSHRILVNSAAWVFSAGAS
jgi:hypothetical protein